MKIRWIALSALTLLCCGVTLAQERAIVLRAARLFDGKSNSLVSPGVVIVVGKNIQAVGDATKISAGAEVIDLGDAAKRPLTRTALSEPNAPFEPASIPAGVVHYA